MDQEMVTRQLEAYANNLAALTQEMQEDLHYRAGAAAEVARSIFEKSAALVPTLPPDYAKWNRRLGFIITNLIHTRDYIQTLIDK